MAINLFCGRSINSIPEEGFSDASALRDWVQNLNGNNNLTGRSDEPGNSTTRPAEVSGIPETEVSNSRLDELFKLLDLNCDGHVAKDELEGALDRLNATLSVSASSDFNAAQINGLSSDLIALTGKTFLGASVYKLFSLAQQSDGDAAYFSLSKEELGRALDALTANGNSGWLSNFRCLGFRMKSGDVKQILFSMFDNTLRDGGELGTVSIGDLNDILGGIKNASMPLMPSADGTVGSLAALAQYKNECDQRNQVLDASAVNGITIDTLEKALGYALKDVLTNLIQKQIDYLEDASDEIKRALERN